MSKKIEIASRDKVFEYKSEVAKILSALDKIEQGWDQSIVTDLSAFADYNLTTEEYILLSQELNTSVTEDDLIIDIAERIK